MTLSTSAPDGAEAPPAEPAPAPGPAPAPTTDAKAAEPGTNVPALWSASESDLKVLRSALVDEKATDAQFAFFIAAAKHLNLDPFKRQIYLVVYQGKPTLQTGIDGYRAQAVRTKKYAGQDPIALVDKVVREDGTIDLIAYAPNLPGREVWPHGPEHPPYAAIASVYRTDVERPFVAVALYSSYVRTTYDQQTQQRRPMANWASMPDVMLSKCAEALALRKAFPDELAGVYTKEEMEQAASEAQPPARETPDTSKLMPAWSKSDTDRRRGAIAWLKGRGLDGARSPAKMKGKDAPEHVRVLNDLLTFGTQADVDGAIYVLETGDAPPVAGAAATFDPDSVPLEGEFTEKTEGKTDGEGQGREGAGRASR